MEIVVATRNTHKLAEIQALLAGEGIRAVSLAAFPAAPAVVEDADTFQGNAEKKAVEIARYTGRVTVADDSGLAVDILGGAPGVYSARYSGPDATDAANNAKLLADLQGVPASRRGARFICCVAVALPRGVVATVTGACRGRIIDRPRGENGFGYDPLFLLPRRKQTFAELPADIKNTLSHRARAFAKARTIILKYARQAAPSP